MRPEKRFEKNAALPGVRALYGLHVWEYGGLGDRGRVALEAHLVVGGAGELAEAREREASLRRVGEEARRELGAAREALAEASAQGVAAQREMVSAALRLQHEAACREVRGAALPCAARRGE